MSPKKERYALTATATQIFRKKRKGQVNPTVAPTVQLSLDAGPSAP
ncbi:MAG: hypothetical protein NTW74_01805 [Acidobacteria bacterium]|nr:hypothetical protein [Acidobacteriota bacterium]